MPTMTTEPIDEFRRRLDLARNGGGILFCGAGFSADCLSFTPNETLGTGVQLLNMFNEELEQDPPYKNLQNAADALWQKIADNGMLLLLKDRFTVARVTSDMTNVLRFPWKAVYTTNYDNAVELSAQAAQIQAEAYNNTDDPADTTKALPIIHLHGFVNKWDIHNIRESCVLGAESYSSLTHVEKWLDRFRKDVDQAQIVVFAGFNAGDFHLNQAIKDVTGLCEKAYFINRPTAQADPDVAAAQKRLGVPFYFGRRGFAERIQELLAKEAPKEPNLASFAKFVPAQPAAVIPTAEQIEDLFLFGKIDRAQLTRDASEARSDYHVRRQVVDDTLEAIKEGSRIVLFDGHPCDGKTLLVEDLCVRLSGVRPVYLMRQPYENLMDEVADILHHAPNATLVIENCFDLPVHRLKSIAHQFDGKDGVLLLSSRAVAVDASPAGMSILEELSSFRRQPLAKLTQGEAQSLSDLADQIAGWRDYRNMDVSSRLRFIRETCSSSLPHFLIRLLRSEYVTNRYREEFNQLSLNETERDVIILALYVSHIGENAPVSFLSNSMDLDFGAVVDSMNRRAENDTFRLVRRVGAMIETVPSIGAVNILNNLFSDAEIVNAVVPLLRNLSETYRNPFEQRMFN